MARYLKWFLLLLGLGTIVGTVVFAVSVNRSVPAGVDMGFEIFYLIAFLLGGLFIFLSTRFRSVTNK